MIRRLANKLNNMILITGMTMTFVMVIPLCVLMCFDVLIGGCKICKAEVLPDRTPVVVLDPGHGGDDPGSGANGITERETNLKIAMYIKECLEEEGIICYLTREDNTTPKHSFPEIAEFAREHDADVVISIHINASSNAGLTGVEVIVPNNNYDIDVYNVGQDLGSLIFDALGSTALGRSGMFCRGIGNEKPSNDTDDLGGKYRDGSEADYYGFIRNCKKRGMPGLIVEYGFLTNSSDAAKLQTDSNLKSYARVTADAIVKYFDEYGTVKQDEKSVQGIVDVMKVLRGWF